jgi:hypothetical protein
MKTIGIDLLDLTHFTTGNFRYLYMLVGVDYFSKFVFIIPLRLKTNKAVVDGMKKMIREQCGGRYPHCIVADNGGEFKNEMLDAWFAENNIRVIHGPTYSPKSNALVEKSNQIIRRVLQALFVRDGNTVWFNKIDEIRNSINESKSESTGRVRNEVFEGLHSVDVAELAKKRNQAKMLKNRNEKFKIGDTVRILLAKVETKIRQRIKAGDAKKNIIHFSLDIYKIVSVSKPSTPLTKETYKVADANDVILPYKFYYTDLIFVPDNTVVNNKLNERVITRLNGMAGLQQLRRARRAEK